MFKTIFVVISVLLNVIFIPAFYADYQDQHSTQHTVFIWNDDEESIPVEGTEVLLEICRNDTVYLSNIE